MPAPVQLFLSYAARDEALREELEAHLQGLTRHGLIDVWHRRRIAPGEAWEAESAARLKTAQIVLLLVSSDYLAADDCFDLELRRVIETGSDERARVIPVILRACDWASTPFARLAALPPGGRPVASWPNRDEAWLEVARGLRAAAEALQPAARPRPVSIDPAFSALGKQLASAHRRRAALQTRGFPTADVDSEIREIRRLIREGGQLRPGDLLGDGRYLLLEKIGHGGFGAVWRAEDQRTEAQVALKVLHSFVAGDPISRDRFFRGVRVMAALEHDAVVRVLDAGSEDEGYHYHAMELLPGGDLRQGVLGGRVAPGRVVPLLLRVGEALALAHARGIVHRDIKPANILLDDTGESKLTDFDLVTDPTTEGGTRTTPMGTFVYAAPEMLSRPQDAGPPADVYGLGMTAVFGLHGRDLPLEVVRDAGQVIDELAASGPLKAALKRAVAWNQAERFRDARAFCDALRESLSPSQPPPSVSPPSAAGALVLAGRDLRGVALNRRDLRGADLRDTDLRGASLFRARLSGADLRRARLIGASLSRAQLDGARLGRADLSGAQLRGANLRGADLDGARLRYAALVGADLDPGAERCCDVFGAALPGAVPALTLMPLPSVRRAVALSPDGAITASAHVDGSLRIARAPTGALLRVIESGDQILSLAWSPDGQKLAAGTLGDTIRLLDPVSGLELSALRGHHAEILDIAWRPDGRLLASASADGSIRLWPLDPESQTAARAILVGHAGPVRSAAFSPEGTTLATCSEDGTAALWDVAGVLQPLTAPARPHPISPRALLEHNAAVTCIAWSPGGELLATGTEIGSVRLWDVDRGDLLHTLEGHANTVWSLSFSADGTLLMTGAMDSIARIWDVRSGLELRSFSQRDREAWRAAAVEDAALADGALAAMIRRIDPRVGAEAPVSGAQPIVPLDLTFSPGGDALAVHVDDGSIRLWDLRAGVATIATGAEVEPWREGPQRRIHDIPIALTDAHRGKLTAAVVHPDRGLLATASLDGTVRLWDSGGRCLAILLTLPGGWAALRPDGRYRLQGPAGGAFWHTIGLCRFDPGELDGVLSTPLRLAEDEALVPPSSAAA